LYILFETNHLDLELPKVENNEDERSEIENVHMVSRLIRQYRNRFPAIAKKHDCLDPPD